jgi:hypothetical protein
MVNLIWISQWDGSFTFVTGPGSTHLSQAMHIPITVMDDKHILYIPTHTENKKGGKKGMK